MWTFYGSSWCVKLKSMLIELKILLQIMPLRRLSAEDKNENWKISNYKLRRREREIARREKRTIEWHLISISLNFSFLHKICKICMKLEYLLFFVLTTMLPEVLFPVWCCCVISLALMKFMIYIRLRLWARFRYLSLLTFCGRFRIFHESTIIFLS